MNVTSLYSFIVICLFVGGGRWGLLKVIFVNGQFTAAAQKCSINLQVSLVYATSLCFLVLSFSTYSKEKLKAFEKTNSAKLVMQVSETEGEPEPVWN